MEDKGHTMIAIAGAVGMKRKEERMLAGMTAEDSTKEEAPEILTADDDVDNWRRQQSHQHHHRHRSQNLCFFTLNAVWLGLVT